MNPVYVKCELLAKINIADKIIQLQNLIKRDLGENIGVEVNKVVKVVALYPLMPNKMSVDRDKNGIFYYEYHTLLFI